MKGYCLALQLSFVVVVVALAACTDTAVTENTYETVEEQAWREIRSGALLVDVRTPDEYADGHLEGAINIPHDKVAAYWAEFGEDKSRPIVLYCRSGTRAEIAKKVLEGHGFEDVLNAGSYEDLRAAK